MCKGMCSTILSSNMQVLYFLSFGKVFVRLLNDGILKIM